MARVFNGSIWGNIGNAVARDDMLRRESNREAIGGLLDMAKFLEKANANRNMRDAWQKYFADRKAAADAALADEAAAARSDAQEDLDAEEDLQLLEDMNDPMIASDIFGAKTGDTLYNLDGTIWRDPFSTVVRFGYDPTSAAEDQEFMEAFDPNTATPEEKRRAQRIIGTTADGSWGPKSIAAYNKYMGV